MDWDWDWDWDCTLHILLERIGIGKEEINLILVERDLVFGREAGVESLDNCQQEIRNRTGAKIGRHDKEQSAALRWRMLAHKNHFTPLEPP
eukprot:scaffold22655_cov61-Attheya_sp.AAC.2